MSPSPTLGTISPSPWFTGLDTDGSPLVGGLLETYVAGTSTPAPTYTDVDLLNPNSNPIVLDAAGRATIFLAAASYKFVLKRADGSTVRTQDNIAATNLGQAGSLGEIFFMGGDPNSPVTRTSYPTGATYDNMHAGSSLFNVDSANLSGTYVLQAMLLGNGGTITLALVDLDDGAPDTPLVTVASNSATGALVISGAITFAAGGAAKNYGVKAKVSAGSGYAWGARIVRTA